MAKLRPMSTVTFRLESVLQEMTDPAGHDLQWHEVLGLVAAWLQTHAPHAQETYTADNSHPVMYYGPKEGIR